MLDRSSPLSPAAPPAPEADNLITTDWYAVRRNRQIRMTPKDRAEYMMWARRIAAAYAVVAIVALGWTAAHSNSAALKQFAGEIRTSLIGQAPARPR